MPRHPSARVTGVTGFVWMRMRLVVVVLTMRANMYGALIRALLMLTYFMLKRT